MTLTFKNVSGAKLINPNEIQGYVGNDFVKITRTFEGWTAKINVTINGIQVHSDKPSQAEIDQYEELVQRAWVLEEAHRNNKREEIKHSMKLLYLPVR